MFPLRAHEHSQRCWWNHEIAGWVCAPVEADVPTPAVGEVRVMTETDVTTAPVGSAPDLS